MDHTQFKANQTAANYVATYVAGSVTVTKAVVTVPATHDLAERWKAWTPGRAQAWARR